MSLSNKKFVIASIIAITSIINDDEIARRMNLSPVAVGLVFNAASKRLRTKNRAATVYRAVALGEIPSGTPLNDSLMLHKDVVH